MTLGLAGRALGPVSYLITFLPANGEAGRIRKASSIRKSCKD